MYAIDTTAGAKPIDNTLYYQSSLQAVDCCILEVAYVVIVVLAISFAFVNVVAVVTVIFVAVDIQYWIEIIAT